MSCVLDFCHHSSCILVFSGMLWAGNVSGCAVFDSFRGKKWTTLCHDVDATLRLFRPILLNLMWCVCVMLGAFAGMSWASKQVMSVVVSSLKVSGQVVCQFVTMLALLGAALQLYIPFFVDFWCNSCWYLCVVCLMFGVLRRVMSKWCQWLCRLCKFSE